MKNPDYERWKSDYPQAGNAYEELYRAVAQSQVLDAKTKQLIYIAVLAVLRYAPAVRAHIPQALAAGATLEEIREALVISVPPGGVVNILNVYAEIADLLYPDVPQSSEQN